MTDNVLYIKRELESARRDLSENLLKTDTQLDVVNNNPDPHNEDMTVTKELLDAKLELIETRMDGRVAAIEVSVSNLNEKIGILSQDIKTFRTHIISTVIVTAVATVIAIASFNATVLSNMVASFDSGKATAESIANATNSLNKQQEELKQMQQEMIKQNAAYNAQRDKPKSHN